MAAPPAPSPVQALVGRLRGFATGTMMGKALAMTLEFDIPNKIGDGHKSAEELAAACKVDAESLFRVLRALVHNGFYTEVSSRVFANNAETKLLRDPLHWYRELFVAWGQAMYTLRTGHPAFEATHAGKNFFEYCEHDPIESKAFNDTMTVFSSVDGEAIVNSYDFGHYKHICDVGGSHGVLIRKILSKWTSVRGTNFDLPAVVSGTPPTERLECIGGSFFEKVPEADAYLLKYILHDWSDDKSVEILKTIHKSIPKHGKVLVVESVVPDLATPGAADFICLLDLHMMTVTPKGKERTQKQWEDLFHKSGFKFENKHAFGPHRYIIEAVPVGK